MGERKWTLDTANERDEERAEERFEERFEERAEERVEEATKNSLDWLCGTDNWHRQLAVLCLVKILYH